MSRPMEFDFDLMARLAAEAPAEFANVREALIRDAIMCFENPGCGTRLQTEIDAVRMSSPSGDAELATVSERVVAIAAMLAKVTRPV